MKNILLIGAGQLGSRHLQGLARSSDPLSIQVVEPFQTNLDTAVNRFNEIEGHEKHEIQVFNSLQEISDRKIDLAILATNADVRASITKELISEFIVQYIIFEKVAFQSELQFEEIIGLLKSHSIKSWVNCPRREFPFYQELKKRLEGQKPIKLEVTGTDWGLGCNSVHQIDLLSYLGGDSKYSIGQVSLEPHIYPGKRKNFIEFYGFYSGNFQSGDQFSIQCNLKKNEDEKASILHRILTPEEDIHIDESKGTAEFFDLHGHLKEKKEFRIIYQSMLTHLQAWQVIETGHSNLPELEISYEIHKPFIRMLLDHYFKTEGKLIEFLPIT